MGSIQLFSRRNGYKPAAKTIQRESLDEETRNRLWNVIHEFLSHPHWASGRWEIPFLAIWSDFFKQTKDTRPIYKDLKHSRPEAHYHRHFKEFFCTETTPWFECFDFMEFIIQLSRKHQWGYITESYGIKTFFADTMVRDFNQVLEDESSAYRVIKDQISEITSSIEIDAIDTAIGSRISPEQRHLAQALNLLSNRQTPDYPNSIKESITAVESMCCSLVPEKNKATLGDALKILEEKKHLHPTLKRAFGTLYGYTSQEAGIRHSGIGFADIDYSLAKFMLVICSAFINYLKQNQTSSGQVLSGS